MFYTLLILLAFFVDISFVHTNYNIPGFSVLISQMIFLCILWLRNRSKLSQNDVSFSIQKILSHGKKFPSIPLLIMLTIVLSIWFSIFTNPLFTWIFLLLLILVNIVLVALLYSPGLTFGIYPYKDGNFLRFIFTTIFSRPDIALSTVRQDLYKNDHIKTYGPTILKAFYGLIILMCIIVPLLLSSDIIFQKLLRDVFSTLFSGLDAFGFIMRVGVIIFIFWLLLTIFRSLEDAYYTENDIHLPSLKIDKIYNYIILGGINCIYLIFVIIQFRYTWFVDATNFSNLGISYGEYIHSGFYQLIIIALINYCIYLFFYKKTHTKNENGIKVNLYLLLICTLLITYSALSRILLYIDVYHMTVLRFFVVYIVFCIMVLFILNLCNLYKENKKYTGIFINIVLITFIILGYSNIESFVAKYNISHSQPEYRDLDINYILGLSNDAIEEKIDLLAKTKDIILPPDVIKDAGAWLIRYQILPSDNIAPILRYNYYQNKLLEYVALHKIHYYFPVIPNTYTNTPEMPSPPPGIPSIPSLR